MHLLRRGSAVENSASLQQRLAESAQGSRDSFFAPDAPDSGTAVRRIPPADELPAARSVADPPNAGRPVSGPAHRESHVSNPQPVAARGNDTASSPADVEHVAADPAQASATAPGRDAAGKARILERAARFKDTRIPLEQREAEIRALAKRGDDEAVSILMALADQYVYLNRAAIEALGTIPKPEVVAYLKSRLGDVNTHDVTLLCECIRSAGKILDGDAVAEVGKVMAAARKREDGHAGPIGEVCIQTLGGLRRPEAVPWLKDELDHMCAQERLDLAHGSEIVKAYAEIGDRRAGEILGDYADFLEERKPEEPMPRRYYEEKILEAREAAQKLTGEV